MLLLSNLLIALVTLKQMVTLLGQAPGRQDGEAGKSLQHQLISSHHSERELGLEESYLTITKLVKDSPAWTEAAPGVLGQLGLYCSV